MRMKNDEQIPVSLGRNHAASPTSTTLQEKFAAVAKRAYRIDEACYSLGIGRTSIYDLIKNKEIVTIKIAGRTLVPHSELERLTRVDRAA